MNENDQFPEQNFKCASKFSLALQAVQWVVLVRGGGGLKSCFSKFWVAQNCASKL